MNQTALLFDNIRALLIYKTNELGDRPLVAGDDARREHDRVALFDRQTLVHLRRHLIERRARLSLRPGDQKDDLVIVELLCLLNSHQQPIRNIEIAKPVGDLDVLLHRAPQHADSAIELLRDVKDDLQTMNRRSKRRDDDAAFGLGKDFFESRNYRAFGWRAAGHSRVGRVGKQRQHAFLSISAERTQIDWFANHRRLVNFVIAGVNDRADRRLDRQRETIDQRMRRAYELDRERADGDHVARLDPMQHYIA